MKEILEYLRTNIDEKATIKKWNAKQYLNIQLAGNYDYYLVTILSESFLLIKPVETQIIQKIKIHIMRIQKETKYEVALLLERPTPYFIKKMLEERIAFLATGKQMYLPFLALHIQKQQKEKLVEPQDKFTPATQLVFLALLYSDEKEFGVEELANDLRISTMTVLRAVDQFKKLGIVSWEISGQTGRKKVVKIIDKKDYYRVGKDYLVNPIKRKMNVSRIPTGVNVYKCGLTALGEQTMLGEPDREILAIYGNVNMLAEYQITKLQALEEKLPEIQIMQYDIGRLTKNQYVDPITLIKSLGAKDDRVDIAIEELMEGIEWYEE